MFIRQLKQTVQFMSDCIIYEYVMYLFTVILNYHKILSRSQPHQQSVVSTLLKLPLDPFLEKLTLRHSVKSAGLVILQLTVPHGVCLE
jgi:hypothetical protein